MPPRRSLHRSQNLAITIAPLARAYDGSFVAWPGASDSANLTARRRLDHADADGIQVALKSATDRTPAANSPCHVSKLTAAAAQALACAIARLSAAPPRVSIEQLETLRGSMPTPDEQQQVAARVHEGVARASVLELNRLDESIAKAKLGALGGLLAAPSASVWERLHCEDIIVAAGGARETSRRESTGHAARLARLRRAFVADQLAPAEKFVYAVFECEAQLAAFSEAADAPTGRLLAARLDALVAARVRRPQHGTREGTGPAQGQSLL